VNFIPPTFFLPDEVDESSFYISPSEPNAISDINPSQQLSFNPRVEKTNSGSFF
jgi:hypothetical protein